MADKKVNKDKFIYKKGDFTVKKKGSKQQPKKKEKEK